MRAVGSAEAEGCDAARSYKPEADKELGHKCRGAGRAEACGVARSCIPKAGLPRSWGRRGRRLTSSEGTRAAGSAEGEGCGAARPYRPKVDKQRGHEGRGIGLSRKLRRS